jgi:hypothetical protein
VAFQVRDRDSAQAFFDAAIAQGVGRCTRHGAGPSTTQTISAHSREDSDGNNIEAVTHVHRQPADRLADPPPCEHSSTLDHGRKENGVQGGGLAHLPLPPSGASPICMKPSPTLGDGPETLQLMARRTTSDVSHKLVVS